MSTWKAFDSSDVSILMVLSRVSADTNTDSYDEVGCCLGSSLLTSLRMSQSIATARIMTRATAIRNTNMLSEVSSDGSGGPGGVGGSGGQTKGSVP